MRLVRDIERRLERLIESPGRVLGGELTKNELEARLVRAGDLSLRESPSGPAAPNRYELRLHPRDLGALPEGITADLAEALEREAALRGWRLEGPAEFELVSDPETGRGSLGWSTGFVPGPRPAWARLVSSTQRLFLRHNRSLLGRDPTCDVLVTHPEVSRTHALIWREGGTAWIEDRASTNGTFVDGLGVPRPTGLQPGATITLGPVSLVFEPL